MASLVSLFLVASGVQAATLTVSPVAGTFSVGSVFTVSVFLNTEGENVNTVGATLTFPSDRLQLVSPSTGSSIITLWTGLPTVDNQGGRVTLQGGIPGGLKVNSGLITTLTFRVKSVGNAFVKFADTSRVLLNDGRGSDSLKQTTNGVYNLVLPPPAGPIVASETNPDQSQWYPVANVALRWALPEVVDGYSYVLDEEPISIPDDISEGRKQSITYTNLADGQRYFHIKALQAGGWGGTTHFSVRVDTTPPAVFPVEIIPDARTTRRQPIIQFATTDALSGLDHYELKIIPLSLTEVGGGSAEGLAAQPLFIETQSPYVPPPLPLGRYEVLVRAYDQAQNWREVAARLSVVSGVFKVIQNQGIQLGGAALIPWSGVWITGWLLIIVLGLLARAVQRWHNRLHRQRAAPELPPEVQNQLRELQQYRAKYGLKAFLLLLLAGGVCFVTFVKSVRAETLEVAPPLVSSLSRHLSNQEIFYAGGKTETAFSTVIIYLQNLKTGETQSHKVISDKQGDWFYRHDAFLISGKYLLWTQGQLNAELSPPSPQFQISVEPTAIQFGSSRLSFEVVYLGATLLLFALVVLLVFYIAFHYYRARKKQRVFLKEVREAEEAVRRGFAIIRRDIEAELGIIKQAKLSKELSAVESNREAQLFKDLREVEKYIGKEIWDIEKYGVQ